MKNKFNVFLILFLFSGIFISFSQESCKVLKSEISGNYSGGCKKGLAHGKGIAKGIDTYEGRFKNGLPNGKGKYTWANGDTYNGYWKNGMRDGEGTLRYKKDGADSVLIGNWGSDMFLKKISLPPYKIYIARDLDKYSITKLNDGNKVSLRLKQMGMQNTDVSDFFFNADNGTYQILGNTYVYSHVIFPVQIKVSYITRNKLKTKEINPVLEIIINEPGEWEIVLTN